jgi:glucose-1-phosphate thymidylyltransferase
VKAIVLAAGYATRLRPLTDSIPKMLLPLAGRPMLDYLIDRIEAVDEIDEIHVVTNARFAGDLGAWATQRSGRRGVGVWNDGTISNDDRLGAIGDLRFTIEQAGLEGEDLLVAAGDNLFEFSLSEYVRFWRSKGDGSCIALYEFPELEQVKQYGVVEIDQNDQVVSLVEKPAEPKSRLISIAVYLYRADHAALLPQYLAEGNSPDQPGHFPAWLHTRAPVYGYRFSGDWLDIGDPQQLLEADNRMRARLGLQPRGEYSLDR